MKCIITNSFYDKKTNELYNIGQTVNFTKARAKELEKRELVRIEGVENEHSNKC